jgi:hypothetical protein
VTALDPKLDMKRRTHRHTDGVQFLMSKQFRRIGVTWGDTIAIANLPQELGIDIAQGNDFHR